MAAIAAAQPPALDAALRDRIDAFVEHECQASGIPGIALAIVQLGSPTHVRGFGDDGRGQAISADTPFPIGSFTKSFTALLVRQAIVAGQLDADAPVQRVLPWFPVMDVRVLSADGVVQVLAPASPPGRSQLLSADFQFRYGEGWFVGPFGAATDARWHLGNLASFAAWMVLLPDTQQTVVVLINANTELPFNEVNAVMSRLPIGVVNLLRGQPVPQGPSLRQGYFPFNAAAALVVIGLLVLVWRAARARRARMCVGLLVGAIAMVLALHAIGLDAAILFAFAPDLALVLAAALALLCMPSALLDWAWAWAWAWEGRSSAGTCQ